MQIQKQYDDNVVRGSVIKTDPLSGVSVEKETKVVLYVSNGPRIIQSKGSYLTWYAVYGSSGDTWNFENPRVEEDNLIVRMKPEINSKFKIVWDNYGYAKLDDGANKSFLVKFTQAAEYCILEIQLGELEDKRITAIDFALAYRIDGEQRFTDFSLIISW